MTFAKAFHKIRAKKKSTLGIRLTCIQLYFTHATGHIWIKILQFRKIVVSFKLIVTDGPFGEFRDTRDSPP